MIKLTTLDIGPFGVHHLWNVRMKQSICDNSGTKWLNIDYTHASRMHSQMNQRAKKGLEKNGHIYCCWLFAAIANVASRVWWCVHFCAQLLQKYTCWTIQTDNSFILSLFGVRIHMRRVNRMLLYESKTTAKHGSASVWHIFIVQTISDANEKPTRYVLATWIGHEKQRERAGSS